MSDLLPPQFEREALACPVCGKPVEQGSWFLVAAQAHETLRTGSQTEGVPQRPVHLACVSPFPLRRPNG